MIYSIYKLPLDRASRASESIAAVRDAAQRFLAEPRRVQSVSELAELVLLNLQSSEVGQILLLRLNVRDDARAVADLLHSSGDVLQHASMSLAVEDAKTALDLCVATAQAAFAPTFPARHGHLADLESSPEKLPHTVRRWHDALLAEPYYRDTFSLWRRALAHRDYLWTWRDVAEPFAGPADWTFRRRRVAEIALGSDGRGTHNVMLPDGVLGVVEFAFHQVELFFAAFQASCQEHTTS